MGTYVMLGEYSIDSVGRISAARTQKASALISAVRGKLKEGYALLGEKDLLIIAEFPGPAEAMKASVAMSKEFGIAFTTAPALTVDEFDKLF